MCVVYLYSLWCVSGVVYIPVSCILSLRYKVPVFQVIMDVSNLAQCTGVSPGLLTSTISQSGAWQKCPVDIGGTPLSYKVHAIEVGYVWYCLHRKSARLLLQPYGIL